MTYLGLIQKQAVAEPCGSSTMGCRNLQDLAPTRKLCGVKNGQKERRVSPRCWGYCAVITATRLCRQHALLHHPVPFCSFLSLILQKKKSSS